MSNKKIDEEIFAKPKAMKFIPGRNSHHKQTEIKLLFWQYQPLVHKKYYYNVKRNKETIFQTMNKRYNKKIIKTDEEKESEAIQDFKDHFNYKRRKHPYNLNVVQDTIEQMQQEMEQDCGSETSSTVTLPSAPPMPEPPLVILAEMAELRRLGFNIVTIQDFRDFLFEKETHPHRIINDQSENIAHEAIMYSETPSEESFQPTQDDFYDIGFEIYDPVQEQEFNKRRVESPIPAIYTSFTPTNFFNDDFLSQSSRKSTLSEMEFQFGSQSCNSTTPIQNIFGTPMPEDY